jgi:hypothetical protein
VNIKVFDDVIPEHLQEFYELSILGRSGEKAIHPIINLKCKYESTAEVAEYPPLSFVHLLKSSTTVSEHLPNFGLIPQLVCAADNKILKDIIVARAFIVMPYETNIEHYAPHVDLPFAHTVVLYYVNDADGDTVFFDKQQNIIKQVSPKRGRVIMFDGTLYHGGGVPKQGPRCVVNFDILTN